MQYTERTTQSWFSRLGSSLGGVFFGIILFLAGTVLLWWNEGDFVKTRDALLEAESITVELPDTSKVDPAFESKLIHATAPAETEEILEDPVFGVGGRAIALERNVEFYQWTEHSKTEKQQKLGGGEETITTYSYSTEWVNHRVNSSNFHAPEARSQYENIVLLSVDDETRYAKDVHFGAYRLPDFFIEAIGGERPLKVSLSNQVRESLTRDILRAWPHLSRSHFASNRRQRDNLPLLHEQGNTLYIGVSPSSPQVGDMRITFEITEPATVSLIARIKGNTFEQFQASNGKNISALDMGNVSMAQMYAGKQSSNVTITWLLRALGTILVIAALRIILSPLSVLASVIPLLGKIVGAGTGLIAFLIGLAWSLVIIAIAWVSYRPTVALLMLAAALGIAASSYLTRKKAQTNA